MDFSSALRAQGLLVVTPAAIGWQGDGLDLDGLIDQGGGVVDCRLLYGGQNFVVQCTPAFDEGDFPIAAAPVITVSVLTPLDNTFRLRAYDPANPQAPLDTWSAFVTVHVVPAGTGTQAAV